jgi:hypothetical protein
MNLSRFLTLLLLMSPLAAQIPGIPPEILEQMRRARSVPGLGRAFGPGGSPVPAGSEGAEGAEGAALQKLLQVQFDRRPDRILAVMAEKPVFPASQAATNLGPARLRSLAESGDWAGLGAFLKRLPTNQVSEVFLHVVQGISQVPLDSQSEGFHMMNGMHQKPPTEFHLRASDVIGLADAKPSELDDADINALKGLLSKAREGGLLMTGLADRLKAGTVRLGGDDPKRRLKAAQLLLAAGLTSEAISFFPKTSRSSGTNDLVFREMWVQSLQATPPGPQRAGDLSRAWVLNLEILADTANDATAHSAALQRQLELLAEIPQPEGEDWLRSVLNGASGDALAVISSVGGKVSSRAISGATESRRADLIQQHRIVSMMLRSPSPGANPWTQVIELLTVGWLREAELTRIRHRPKRARSQMFDPYGNRIYNGEEDDPMMMQRMGNHAQAIPLESLMPTIPSEPWIALLSPGVQAKTRTVLADLLAKAEDDAGALGQIEALQRIDPAVAGAAAAAFLTAWTKAHDPNPPPQNSMIYQQNSGMPQPQGIALTRSRQVRNLKDLSVAVARLRKSVPRLDPASVARAFVAAHGTAEVFRAEDILAVVGAPEDHRPVDLLPVFDAMRMRLGAPWRNPKIQQDARTRRTREEVEAQVHRGYSELTDLLARLDSGHPGDPDITMLRATVLFDKTEFDYGRKVDLKTYSTQRDLAFGLFAKAADLKSGRVQAEGSFESAATVLLQWFNAALGASDLSYLTRQAEADPTQLDRIRSALLASPEPAQDGVLESFGAGINRSLETLKPELKPRYLRAAMKVLGDHPSAGEVRRLVRHHEDLLGEVLLDVRIDGPAEVGHGEPFGVMIALRYTDELGREGGNFSKYLQNQQQGGSYPNPFGMPPVNYRDDFEKHLKATWEKGFEILSVTFNDPDSVRRLFGRSGWLETPYAYVVAKAKDASVDRLPSLRLDLDFTDRMGPVILPIQSQVQLIDARSAKVAPRSLAGGEVVQVLDDRTMANSGELGLEIKVTGRGLQPDVASLLDLSFPGFRVDRKSGTPANVLRLETTENSVAPVTEQSLVLSLKPDPVGVAPSVFRFAPVRQQGLTNVLKRYVDADLVEAAPEVPLPVLRVTIPLRRFGWPSLTVLIAVFGGVLIWRFLRSRAIRTPVIDRHPVPRNLSPFSIVQYLERIADDPGLDLSPELRSRLSEDLRSLQIRHFAPSDAPVAEAAVEVSRLEEVARNWSRTINLGSLA